MHEKCGLGTRLGMRLGMGLHCIPYFIAASWLQLATTRLCLYGLQTTQQQVNFLVVVPQL